MNEEQPHWSDILKQRIASSKKGNVNSERINYVNVLANDS